MSDDATVVVLDAGDRREYTVEEYIDAGGSSASLSLLAGEQERFDSGELEEWVDHNPGVVKRAREEDGVFVGQASFQGWMVNDDDNAPDRWRDAHPGANLSGRFLMEDYSENAWRLIAQEEGGSAGEWFVYRWVFLPKSKTKVVRVTGIRDRDHAEDIGVRAHEKAREAREDSWEEQLERVDGEP